MWQLQNIKCDFKLWFSDGQAVDALRPQAGMAYRLIVDKLGFLDLVEAPLRTPRVVEANGEVLIIRSDSDSSLPQLGDKSGHDSILHLHLSIDSTGEFTLSCASGSDSDNGHSCKTIEVSGQLKPLPSVSDDDVKFINTKIEEKYVPYPLQPGMPGKTTEEIKVLGERLFPFTPHSFQLAMCVYDWTTASFARMVFLKIFEYTGISSSPFPLDQNSIAQQIWTSNWGPYTPKNKDYMRSFLMQPADSLDNVKSQLRTVAKELQEFSNVENRLLAAALQSLPRTSIFQHQQLFSGQVDIYQLGLDHFGLEFLECPLNKGPPGKELKIDFADVLSTYGSAGKIITTKMVWSATDSVKDAMHYSNGILLVMNFPPQQFAWDRAAYVTPLSHKADKIEYLFMAGTRFKVQTIYDAVVEGKKTVVIDLLVVYESEPESEPVSALESASAPALKSMSVSGLMSVSAALMSPVSLFTSTPAPEATDITHEIHKALPGTLEGHAIVDQVTSCVSCADPCHGIETEGGRRYVSGW